MKRKLGVVPTAGVLALALTLVLTACGGNSDPKSAAERESEAREAALNYAQCMREHGIDMPDPTFEGGGSLQTGLDPEDPDDFKREKFREAERACRKYMEDIEPPDVSEEEQQEFREAALANARCMREHGIENFPDPTFGENGEARIRLDRGEGLNPEDPDFKEAQEACKDTMPKLSEESAP
jgi:hypothetical protein